MAAQFATAGKFVTALRQKFSTMRCIAENFMARSETNLAQPR
jgi:hypothetical protein